MNPPLPSRAAATTAPTTSGSGEPAEGACSADTGATSTILAPVRGRVVVPARAVVGSGGPVVEVVVDGCGPPVGDAATVGTVD
jgi:hypothetical protein